MVPFMSILTCPLFWPFCSAVAFSLLLFPAYIGWLKQRQMEQFVREEGPASHAIKAKTPTMGGLCFIAVSLIVSLVALFVTLQLDKVLFLALAVIVISVACGMVGFVDDYAKITSRSNRGIAARVRLLIEFFLGALLASVLLLLNGSASVLLFTGAAENQHLILTGALSWGYWFILVPFLVAASANAVNLHDGMDGLAGGTASCVFFLLACMLLATGQLGLAIIAVTVAGSLVGFLFFNRYPAKVFMGDTGSLFLGAAMACLVAAGGLLIYFVPLALIYIVETLSVMAQVIYFKLTKNYEPQPPLAPVKLLWVKLTQKVPGEGKRLLRMAPVHHHFEAIAEEAGKKEWVVVLYFCLIQLAICVLVAALFFST